MCGGFGGLFVCVLYCFWFDCCLRLDLVGCDTGLVLVFGVWLAGWVV